MDSIVLGLWPDRKRAEPKSESGISIEWCCGFRDFLGRSMPDLAASTAVF